MKKIFLTFLFFALAGVCLAQDTLSRVRISPNGHFLQLENGEPFFWLGDTGWEMFNRLTKDEITLYMDNRKQKGFNIIQAVILDDNANPIGPNRNGDKPLINNNPARPNEAFFKMIDWGLQQAAQRGLYIGLLPTWGSNVSKVRPNIDILFNKGNAYQYGLFLGKRYKAFTNIIWIIGGDVPPRKDDKDWRPVWQAMAKGIRDGAGNKVLISYHPQGESSSTKYWQGDNTIDINMIQSGHRIPDLNVWDWVRSDYNLVAAKPVLDGEPNYEDHPINWQNNTGRFTDYDVRKQLYRSVFSGACGVTYGHHSVWQFYSKLYQPISYPDRTWIEALDRPGAFQAGYLKKLILSRPSLERVPDQTMIKTGQGDKGEYIAAFHDEDRTYAMIYLPVGKAVTINTSIINAKNITATWFNPKTGKAGKPTKLKNTVQPLLFTPPTTGKGNDWVLILDNASKKYTSDF